VQFHEKGGKEHTVPCHHSLEKYLDGPRGNTCYGWSRVKNGLVEVGVCPDGSGWEGENGTIAPFKILMLSS
jgi:hypothetical protein